MINIRKYNKAVFLCMIVVLISSFFLTALGNTTVYSEENEDSEAPSHSGGFIIESEKVEGQMDLLGALAGKVDITEGKIYGLTITKVLEMGEGNESLIIKIKSPGPINVNNLYAETLGGSLPEFSGLCLSDQLGWLCLQDVKMTVAEQTAAAITLPDAKVETCFESECDSIPEQSTMTKDELLNILQEAEEDTSTIEDIIQGIEEDKEQLEKINDLKESAASSHEVLLKEGQIEALEQTIEDITAILNSENKKEEKDSLVSLTEELSNQYDTFEQSTEKLQNLINEANELMEQLEISINENVEALLLLEQEKKDNPVSQQAEAYAELLEVANQKNILETEETTGETNKEESEKQGSSESNENETNEQNAKAEVDLEDIRNEVDTFKEEINITKKELEVLNNEVTTIVEQKDAFKTKIESLKASIIEIINTGQDEDDTTNPENDTDGSNDGTNENDTDLEDEDSDSGNEEDNEGSEPDTEEDGNEDDTNTDTGNDDEETNDEEDEENSDSEDDEGNIITDLLDWLLNL